MKYFLFSVMITVSQTFLAQTAPVKKVYAYRQAILQGKKPSHQEEAKSTDQYFLFAEFSKNQKAIINGIWIQNNYYSYKTKQHLKLPVKKAMMEGMEDVLLVPKTGNSVYEIIVTKPINPSPRPGRELGLLLQKNEVVISYTYKGKQYYATAEKMIVLESMPLQ
jgi:hypothetical protein